MLFTLRDRRQLLYEKKKKAAFTLGGGAVSVPAPDSFANLVNWFKPADISCPAGNFNDWLESQNLPDKMSGVACISGTTCDCIGTLNSKQFLISDVNAASLMSYTTPLQMCRIGSYTIGGILNSKAATSGLAWNIGTNVGSTKIAFQQDGAGKLNFFVRSTNGQSAQAASTTVWNLNGWKIFVATFDYVAKTSTLYEGGNTIAVTNALMDNFVYGTPAVYFNGGNGGVSKWIGDIGEMFIYSDVKSTSVVNQLGNYLASEYILSWNPI